MSGRETKYYNLVTSWAVTAQTAMLKEMDYRNCVIEVVTVGFTWTLLFYHSAGKTTGDVDTPADLTSSAWLTNKYAAAMSVNLDTGAIVAGTTGYSYTTSTAVEYFEINTNLNYFIGAKYTRSAGSITLNVIFSDNE